MSLRSCLAIALCVSLAASACRDMPTSVATDPLRIAPNTGPSFSHAALVPVLYAFNGSRTIVRLDPGTWAGSVVFTPSNQILDGLSGRADGTLVATHGDPSTFVRELVRIDAAHAVESKTALTPGLHFSAMAQHPTAGLLGVTNQNNLYSVAENGAATLLGNLNLDDGSGLRVPYVEDFAQSADGKLYALIRKPGDFMAGGVSALSLAIVNPATAAVTAVASLGSVEYAGLEEFGTTLLATACLTDGPQLYNQIVAVDRATGVQTPLGRATVANSMDCLRDLASGTGPAVAPLPPPCTVNCAPLPPPPPLPPCTVNCGPPPCTVNCGPPPCTVSCTVNEQSQTDVTIFVDPGTPLPPPPGQLPPPVSPAGVAPGTNLIARVHVNSLQGGEGISGAFTGRVLGPDGSILYPWTGTSDAQGIIDVRFQAGALAGNYTMFAVFAGSSRTGPDGVTTQYTASSGERSFLVTIPNTPPVAKAGPDQSVFRTSPAGVTVTLDGSGSSDAQGPIASYQWFEAGVLIATGATPQVSLALGPHNVMLRVTDAGGLSAQDFVNIQVKNVPPVARAGIDQALECVSGGAMATLDASGSTDLDGMIIEYRWGASLGPSVVQRWFALGTHQVLLGVIDNDRAGGNDNLQVTIRDTRAPTIQMTVSPNRIWPPNHKMVKVATGIGATDECGPAPTVTVSVTDNEEASSSDWEIVRRPDGRYDVWVRAERNGSGTGRIYSVTASATDASGNVSSQTATVTVPHDNSGGDK